MYYSLEDIDSVVRCAFCGTKFTDVVKLIPECGNSICGDCYTELKQGVEQAADYKCEVCDETHVLPMEGLADDHTAIKMLKMQPREKKLSRPLETLKLRRSEIQDGLLKLQSFDGASEINSYCDQMESSLVSSAESAVSHLKEQRDKLKAQIDSYRAELLESFESKHSEPDSELAKLALEIAASDEEWRKYFEIDISDLDTRDYNIAVNKHLADIKTKENELRRNTFDNRILYFVENTSFFISSDHFGKLKTEFETEAVNGEWKVKHQNYKKEPSIINKISFESDNRLYFGSQNGSLNIFDNSLDYKLRQLKKKRIYKSDLGHPVYSFCVLHNNYVATTTDNDIFIWSTGNNETPSDTLSGHSEMVFSVLTLKNGNLASCSFDGTIKIWDPFANRYKSSLLSTIEGHGVAEWSIQLAQLSNGDLIIPSSQQNSTSTIRIWNSNDGRAIKTLQTTSINPLAFLVLPDESVAVSSIDGSIQIINLKDQTKSKRFNTSYGLKIMSLAWHPDGFLFGGGSACDPTIRIWNPESGNLVKTFQTGFEGHICALAVSHDGKRVAFGSDDGDVILWSIEHSNEIKGDQNISFPFLPSQNISFLK